MNINKILAVGLIGVSLIGCQPSGPPPDLVKTQRDALNKAKAVEGVVFKQADEQQKAAEEAGK
jgi:hypothetical protein